MTYSAFTGDFTAVTFNGKSCLSGGGDTWTCNQVTFHNINGIKGINLAVHKTPEPTTIAILASSLAGLAALRRRRRAVDTPTS